MHQVHKARVRTAGEEAQGLSRPRQTAGDQLNLASSPKLVLGVGGKPREREKVLSVLFFLTAPVFTPSPLLEGGVLGCLGVPDVGVWGKLCAGPFAMSRPRQPCQPPPRPQRSPAFTMACICRAEGLADARQGELAGRRLLRRSLSGKCLHFVISRKPGNGL